MKSVREMRVGLHGTLHIGEIYELRNVLNSGGVLVLPSDTCYALAGLPFVRGVVRLIDEVLDRGEEKVSLAFGSLLMAERYVHLSTASYRLTDDFMPGPITLVAPLRRDLEGRDKISSLLHTQGTMGVRIPDSNIERQISTELDSPITTTAIRYANGTGTKHYDDAIDIVLEGLAAVDRPRPPIAAIRHPKARQGEQSTVVETTPSADEHLVVHREGAVSDRDLLRAVDRYHYRDVEDWT